MNTEQYEAEVKFEILESDIARVKATLEKLDFTYVGEEVLEDYYLTTRVSPHGGWNFVRLRKSDKKYIRTQKTWQKDADGSLLRQEDEQEVPDIEANKMIQKDYVAHLTKTRSEYTGSANNAQCTICIDAIELDGQVRYFLECERITEKSNAAAARQQLQEWASEHLAIVASVEARSMLELVMQQTKP